MPFKKSFVCYEKFTQVSSYPVFWPRRSFSESKSSLSKIYSASAMLIEQLSAIIFQWPSRSPHLDYTIYTMYTPRFIEIWLVRKATTKRPKWVSSDGGFNGPNPFKVAAAAHYTFALRPIPFIFFAFRAIILYCLAAAKELKIASK